MAETVVPVSEEPSGFRFSWGLAFAGGVVAVAVTLFLLLLGSGIGLLLVNPVKHTGPSAPAFLTGGAIYFFAAQAFGFAVGGHLAGRLLGPQIESRIQEEFRAAAHGLVAWAIAILGAATLVTLAGAAALGGGMSAAPLYGANASGIASTSPAYVADRLFWPNASTPDSGPRAEAIHILQAGVLRGEQLSAAEHDRLASLVAQEAHVPAARAAQRVDAMEAEARQTADAARHVASYASLWIALSLLFGAIVAVVAAITARIEDDRDAWHPFALVRNRG